MDDDFLRNLIEMNDDAKQAHTRYLGLKEGAADAKKSWEAKVTAIQEAIDGYGKDYPLFDRPAGGGPHNGGGGGGGGGDDGPGPVSPPPGTDGEPIDVEFTVSRPQLPAPAFLQAVPANLLDDAWRSVPIDDLAAHGLTDKTITLMDEAAIRTIGSLADWNRESNRLTDIPGVGEARASEIEEAMDSFWAAWTKRDAPKSGGDLVTSRPGTWTEEAGEEPAKPKRKKKTA